jgi:hypothetical protein
MQATIVRRSDSYYNVFIQRRNAAKALCGEFASSSKLANTMGMENAVYQQHCHEIAELGFSL